MALALTLVFVASVAASTLVALWLTAPLLAAHRSAAAWMKIQEEINRQLASDSDRVSEEFDKVWRAINEEEST